MAPRPGQAVAAADGECGHRVVDVARAVVRVRVGGHGRRLVVVLACQGGVGPAADPDAGDDVEAPPRGTVRAADRRDDVGGGRGGPDALGRWEEC